MTQTLRRNIKSKISTILQENKNNDSLADLLTDAVLEIINPKKPESVEWLLAGGASKEQIESVLEREKKAKLICDTYEREMGYGTLPWLKLERLKQHLLKQSVEDIKIFARWSKGKYSGFSPAKARQFPDMVIELWPQAFEREKSQVERIMES